MDEEKFVRKDVFEAQMLRIEALMDRNIARHEAITLRIEGKLDTLTARLDTLQSRFSWNLAWLGIVMGLVLAIVQHVWK